MNTVTVCAVEELNRVSKSQWNAPPHLAAVMANYAKR